MSFRKTRNNFWENKYCTPRLLIFFSGNCMESQKNCSGMNLNGQVLISSYLREDIFVGCFFGAHLFENFLKTCQQPRFQIPQNNPFPCFSGLWPLEVPVAIRKIVLKLKANLSFFLCALVPSFIICRRTTRHLCCKGFLEVFCYCKEIYCMY